ncbi:hypothetical protein D3C85_452210 [compost metagenome]
MFPTIFAPFTLYVSVPIPVPKSVILKGDPVKHCLAGTAMFGNPSSATNTSNIFLLQLLASNTYTSQFGVVGFRLPILLAV